MTGMQKREKPADHPRCDAGRKWSSGGDDAVSSLVAVDPAVIITGMGGACAVLAAAGKRRAGNSGKRRQRWMAGISKPLLSCPHPKRRLG